MNITDAWTRPHIGPLFGNRKKIPVIGKSDLEGSLFSDLIFGIQTPLEVGGTISSERRDFSHRHNITTLEQNSGCNFVTSAKSNYSISNAATCSSVIRLTKAMASGTLVGPISEPL